METAGRSEEPAWLVVRSVARHERRVVGDLGALGLEHYLPVVPIRRRWSDRWKVVEWPLFPGYVFVRLPLADWGRLFAVGGVLTVVLGENGPAIVPAKEIANVQSFAAVLARGDVPADRLPMPPSSPGDAVVVTEGPLAGIRGVVLECRGRLRIVIGLTTIGEGVAVNVAAASLRSAEPSYAGVVA